MPVEFLLAGTFQRTDRRQGGFMLLQTAASLLCSAAISECRFSQSSCCRDASLGKTISDRLYNHHQHISREGQPVARPSNPSLAWHFDDLKFGILDRRTKEFFCKYPFFAR